MILFDAVRCDKGGSGPSSMIPFFINPEFENGHVNGAARVFFPTVDAHGVEPHRLSCFEVHAHAERLYSLLSQFLDNMGGGDQICRAIFFCQFVRGLNVDNPESRPADMGLALIVSSEKHNSFPEVSRNVCQGVSSSQLQRRLISCPRMYGLIDKNKPPHRRSLRFVVP